MIETTVAIEFSECTVNVEKWKYLGSGCDRKAYRSPCGEYVLKSTMRGAHCQQMHDEIHFFEENADDPRFPLLLDQGFYTDADGLDQRWTIVEYVPDVVVGNEDGDWNRYADKMTQFRDGLIADFGTDTDVGGSNVGQREDGSLVVRDAGCMGDNDERRAYWDSDAYRGRDNTKRHELARAFRMRCAG